MTILQAIGIVGGRGAANAKIWMGKRRTLPRFDITNYFQEKTPNNATERISTNITKYKLMKHLLGWNKGFAQFVCVQ